MDVTSYTIRGAGPAADDSFEVSGHTEGLFTRDGLAVGQWTITVDGYNSDSEKIATVQATATVTRNATAALTMVLRPLEGTGTLSVGLSWTDSQGVLASPSAGLVIRDEQGNDIQDISDPVALTINGQTAAVEVTNLPTGWYEVTVSLKDGNTTAWQGVFALRVVDGQTTTGTVAIPESQIQVGPGTGTVAITIEEDMDDPLSVGFSGMPDSVEAGTEITLTSTGTYSGAEQYRWYINGVRQEGQATSSFSHTFTTTGTHTVSLLVLDGGALGGYGQSMVVVEEEQTSEYTVGDIGPSGGYVFYENPNHATDGWRYLEAAPAINEYTGKVWGGYGTAVGGTGTGIGTGASNTQKIVATFGNAEPYQSKTDYAAKLCADLVVTKDGVQYDDWFLPSKDELNLMRQNLYLNNLGGFSDFFYWSSSEYNAIDAWYQFFFSGDQYYNYRDGGNRVRPVRAF